MNQNLLNKKVLMFSTKFFNYEEAIKDEIILQGGIVHLYDERGNPSSLEKILLRKAHFLMKRKINRYYSEIIKKESKENFDIILFINPEGVNCTSLSKMKKTFTKSRFILYMWDSLRNKKVKKILPYFDKKFSFDKNDCNKYGFIFRPLFFTKEFETPIEKDKKYKYDFSFIGSIHGDRAVILNNFRKYFESNLFSFCYYLYIPGRLMFFIRYIIDKNVRALSKYCIHLKPMNKKDISSIISNTNCVIDINHPKQVGLTMRTIEMLGMNKKIITTNEHIKEYDFYKPQNQIVIPRRNCTIDISNLSSYIPIPDEIYKKYKLSSWIDDIIE